MGKRPYPGNVDWLEMADAARRNAATLHADAHLLLLNERPARAYSLAVLGLEEVGKYYLCLHGATGVGDAADIWRRLDLHGEKLAVAANTAALFSSSFPSTGVIARCEKFLAEESKTKFRGLYVDWNEGQVSEPTEVPAGAAAEIVALLDELSTFILTHELSQLAPNIAEVDLAGEMAKVQDQFQDFMDHLKSLEPGAADALARTTADALVAMLRSIIGPNATAEGAAPQQSLPLEVTEPPA